MNRKASLKALLSISVPSSTRSTLATVRALGRAPIVWVTKANAQTHAESSRIGIKRYAGLLLAALLPAVGVNPALAGKPTTWVRNLSQLDVPSPNCFATQDFNPQRGWGYRDYKNASECQELMKQAARAGIKVVLLDQTSFNSDWFDAYNANPYGAMSGNILAGIKTQEAAHRNGMTVANVIGFEVGSFSNAAWDEANKIAEIFWNENVTKPGYEYANGVEGSC